MDRINNVQDIGPDKYVISEAGTVRGGYHKSPCCSGLHRAPGRLGGAATIERVGLVAGRITWLRRKRHFTQQIEPIKGGLARRNANL